MKAHRVNLRTRAVLRRQRQACQRTAAALTEAQAAHSAAAEQLARTTRTARMAARPKLRQRLAR